MSFTKRSLALVFFLLSVHHHGVSQATICSARGRFPNNLRADCRGYTMCLSGATSLVNYDLTCPEQSIYSHIEKQCTNVTSYQCLQSYTCTEERQFPYESSEHCDSYVACVIDLNNVTTARLIKCPPNEVFSSIENTCVNKTMFECHPLIETPKVFQVSENQFPGLKRNDSDNSAVCVNYRYMTLLLCFALLFSK